MANGTVKWFDTKKGFGFIVNAQGTDVFVHFSSIVGDGFRALKDGEKVEYEEITGDKGLSAKNVKRLIAAAKEVARGLDTPAADHLSESELSK